MFVILVLMCLSTDGIPQGPSEKQMAHHSWMEKLFPGEWSALRGQQEMKFLGLATVRCPNSL